MFLLLMLSKMSFKEEAVKYCTSIGYPEGSDTPEGYSSLYNLYNQLIESNCHYNQWKASKFI